ncbi:MAG: hypothetical protein N2C14_04720, partial [Planctomycetales bacterium]
MLWEVDIFPMKGQPDLDGRRVVAEAVELGLPADFTVASASGYLLQGALDAKGVRTLAARLLSDPVSQRTVVGRPDEPTMFATPENDDRLVHVVPRAGVMDPVAQSALAAATDMGFAVEAARTLRKYWISGLNDDQFQQLCSRVLANDAVEQVVVGKLPFDQIEIGSPYRFALLSASILGLDDE